MLDERDNVSYPDAVKQKMVLYTSFTIENGERFARVLRSFIIMPERFLWLR